MYLINFYQQINLFLRTERPPPMRLKSKRLIWMKQVTWFNHGFSLVQNPEQNVFGFDLLRAQSIPHEKP